MENVKAEECFVMMPISDQEGYEAGHFRCVYEDVIKPACLEAGYEAVRSDDVRGTDLIHLDILRRIVSSPMAVCDLSAHNPSVMFELGMRQAFDNPVVLIQEQGTKPVFDIVPWRYTEYGADLAYRDVVADQKNIAEALTATKDGTGDGKFVNSIVHLLSIVQAVTLASVGAAEAQAGMLRMILDGIGSLSDEVKRGGAVAWDARSAVMHSVKLQDRADTAAAEAVAQGVLLPFYEGEPGRLATDLARVRREREKNDWALKTPGDGWSSKSDHDMLGEIGAELELQEKALNEVERMMAARGGEGQ